jgi:predicted dienelactone hydrolase
MSRFRAGCRDLELNDERTGDAIPLLVFYPASTEETARTFGPYTVDAAWNAPLVEDRNRLALISHGSGGSRFTLRTLAQFLARNGWMVLALEHPRNNRNNNDLAGTAQILENRPRHLSIVLDWAFAEFGPLPTGAVAVIGHSLGAYTALALAGGRPKSFPWESQDKVERAIDVVKDDRANALVLLAPATVWFRDPDALLNVQAPVLMLTAEKDQLTPPFHAEIVKSSVMGVEHRVVANAGHFSFLSPFPATMARPEFAPSQDPDGFDRSAFHKEMNREILDFMNNCCKPARGKRPLPRKPDPLKGIPGHGSETC